MSDPHMALKVHVLPGWVIIFGVCIYLVFCFILAKHKNVII